MHGPMNVKNGIKRLGSKGIFVVVHLYSRCSLRTKNKRTSRIDATPVHSFVTRYQRLHRLSGFNEHLYRCFFYKQLSKRCEFCENQLGDILFCGE
jgi:hypothetical protein